MSLDPSSGMDKTIADLYRLKKYKRYFKYIALGLIGISLILVFLWPYLEQVPVLLFNQKFMNGRLQVGKIDLKRKFVENPKFIGGGERPYILMADRAQQVGEDKVVLDNVQARITLKDSSILSVLSRRGDIQLKDKRHANLYGNVNIIYEKGDTEIWTNSLFVDLKEGFLETSDKVDGISFYGKLHASQGIYIHQAKQLYKLKGPSELMITQLGKENS